MNINDVRKIGADVKVMVGVRLDQSAAKQLKALCEKERVSVSSLVAKLITEYLKGGS